MTKQSQLIAELDRKLNNIIRTATITHCDFSKKKFRAEDGDLKFSWLAWPCEIGRNFKRWHPLRVGTQVILASTGGDTTQARLIGMLYTQSLDSPSHDPAVDLIEWNDGSKIEYNSDTQHMIVNSVGDLKLRAGKTIYLDAPEIKVFEDG